MAAVRAVIPFLVGMMLLTGVCNTLLTKYQDQQCISNCDSPDPKKRHNFEQPVIQTAQMFIGEMGCWLVVLGFKVYSRYSAARETQYQPINTDDTVAESLAEDPEGETTLGSVHHGHETEPGNPLAKPLVPPPEPPQRMPLTGWKVLWLALPAICDILGTTLMNVGLLFVAASIYQMMRGALILFVGVFSVVFLKRRLGLYKWFALFVVVLGVTIVGLAPVIQQDRRAQDGNKIGDDSVVRSSLAAARIVVREVVTKAQKSETLLAVIGGFLIIGAQVFTATQFVLEESIMEKYSIEPLKVVGWEGLFGFSVTVIGMIILHFAVGRTEAGRGGYFDAREGLYEWTHYRAIFISSFLIMISIGCFNFFGISVTRSISATARSIIDTCRTLFIWIISLGLGWETFKWLQVLGFVLLIYGTFLFNDLIRPPLKACVERSQDEEELLPERPVEHN